jgi:hypothetical protein
MPSISHIKNMISTSDLPQPLKQALVDLAREVDDRESEIRKLSTELSRLQSDVRHLQSHHR